MDPESSDKKAGPGAASGGPGIPQIEEEIIKFWEENGIFEKSLEKTKDGAPYTFYDGPPFATGLPHYGHILASTIKDLIPRYQTMRGRFVRRRWGWDCHGLPIEALVEKKLEISGKKQIEEVGIKTFNETCRSMVLQYAEEWGRMVRRMGRWVDFSNSYKTMDRDYMESVWWAFKQVYDKDLAYEGRKVLLYCPRCETPISNFEVAMDNSYKDVTEESVYVKFKVKGEDNTYFLAWTTTPWTLPGNVALAVGNEIDYVAYKIGESGETHIASSDFYKKGGNGFYIESSRLIKQMKGKDLVGMSYEPLFEVPDVAASDKSHKVYAADFVTTEDGTGIVHTAVVYGEDDYQLGLREGLPVVPLLDEKGHFSDKAPELVRGQYFKKSEKAVKEDLEARGLLLKREAYTHPYPHCWRCGTALFYNAIPAWFINVQKIKPDLLKTNEEQINWFPEHLKHGRYQKSVEAAPDWNISRNRYWGNPIPVWKCEECGKNTVAGSLEDIAKRTPPARNRYIFLRHGESKNFVHNVSSSKFETQSPYDLTPEGVSHVELSVEKLKDEKVDLIYASDFKRTAHTAEIAAKALGVPEVRGDERLREIKTGQFDERPIAEYKAFFRNRMERFIKRPADGENLVDTMARAWDFLRDMEQKHEGKTVLIVSHEDLIWMAETVMRGWDRAKSAAAKGETSKGFIAPAEIHEAPLLGLPRNDNGEVDLHRPYIDEVVLKCDHCGGSARRTPEIFDSWVEAGSMPFSEYHYPFENKEVFESRSPAQFVAEYIAQTRAWFYVMHVISQILFGKAPFENVVTTGTILAEDGSKMSKSKNNYPDPWLVIDKYGVDTLRFYLMSSVVMQADNLNFSSKDLENIYRKTVMILWNVRQYFLTYSKETSAGSSISNEGRKQLDDYIKGRAKDLVRTVTESLDGYDTVRASRAITGFIDILSTVYLRDSRGRNDDDFLPTLRAALSTVSKVIAPFMPHIAEAIYRDVKAGNDPESVHLGGWPETEEASPEEEAAIIQMDQIAAEVSSMGMAWRKEKDVPVKQPLASIYIETAGGISTPISPGTASILSVRLNIENVSDAPLDVDNDKVVQSKGGLAMVQLDFRETPELRFKGEVRKLERFVQEMRKKQGFEVGEMAVLQYETRDADIKKALAALSRSKTYLRDILEGSVAGEAESFEGRASFGISRD